MELLVTLPVLLIVGFAVHAWSAQPASRYLLTVAAVDDHSLRLDSYESYLGLDQARSDGHVYSDKAPYQPLLATVPFQLFRMAGGDSFPPDFLETSRSDEVHYGLWWVTLWSSTIPAAILVLVVRRMVALTHPELATTVALATVLGTTILPFAGWLFGHVLAALFVATAWHLIRRESLSRAAAFAGGVSLGLAIGAEFAVAVIALVMLVHVATLRSGSALVALAGGAVLATAPLAAYNWLVFGGPFEVSYQGHLANFQGEGALGVYNLQAPRLGEIGKTLIGNRGLLVLTPIVAFALIGAGVAIAKRTQLRRDSWIALSALIGMIAVSTGIDGYGGDSPGPRYLIPALPLLALPMAELWRRLPVIGTAATAVGAVCMVAASITDPAVDTSRPQPLRVWFERLVDGDLATNVLTGRSSAWPLVMTVGAGLLLAALLVRSEHRQAAALDQRPG